jgi:hypothetical protein
VKWLTRYYRLVEHECHEDHRGRSNRPDVMGTATMVAKIAAGTVVEEEDRRSVGKIRSGKAGAKARAKRLTVGKRRNIAKRAAAARWS